jgi:hypothetical protein
MAEASFDAASLWFEFACPFCGLDLDSKVARRDDCPVVQKLQVTP